MVDRIEKILRKLSDKERRELLAMTKCIVSGQLSGFDIKKLQGFPDIYRVRKGRFRIIFSMPNRSDIRIIAIERKSDTTYR